MTDKLYQIEKDLEMCKETVEKRLEEGDQEMAELRTEIASIKEGLNELRADVGEILEIFRASKGFARVLYWLGVAAKWILSIAAVVGILIAAVKGYTR